MNTINEHEKTTTTNITVDNNDKHVDSDDDKHVDSDDCSTNSDDYSTDTDSDDILFCIDRRSELQEQSYLKVCRMYGKYDEYDDEEEEAQIRFTEDYEDSDDESELFSMRECSANCILPGNFEIDFAKIHPAFRGSEIKKIAGLPWDAMTSNEKMFCNSMQPQQSSNEALIDYMNMKRRKSNMPLLNLD